MSNGRKAATAAAPREETVQEQGLLDQIIEEGRFSRDATARERGTDMVKEFVAQVLQGEMTVSRDSRWTYSRPMESLLLRGWARSTPLSCP